MKNILRWIRQKRRQQPDSLLQQPNEIFHGELTKGKTVLVCGVGPNLGWAIAAAFAEQGSKTILVDKDERQLATVAKMVTNSHPYVCDVSDLNAIDALCENVWKAGLSVDVVVNVAALQVEKALPDSAELIHSFQTNLIGPEHLTRRFVQRMVAEKRQGSIIFLSSMHGTMVAGWPAYSTTKAAIEMLVKELALSLGPHGIRVNGIAPGWVPETPQPSKWAILHGQSIPAEYIGRTAVYLASDYFSYFTTGRIITIDAGMSVNVGRVTYDPVDSDVWGRES